MRHRNSVLIAILSTAAVSLGPLSSRTEASRRQSYRAYSHRTYRTARQRPTHQYRSHRYRPRSRSYYRSYGYRPHYRSHYRPYYRSYYRPYYGAYYRPYVGWGGYWPSWGWYGWPSVGLYFGGGWDATYYGGGAAQYSYRNGAVQTKVKLREAQVYVDGYYAGTVDDFDGRFQRLYLPPGEHEILLRLEGYRTHRQTLLINSGTTHKLRHEMAPLGPGETTPPPPEPERQSYEYREQDPTYRPEREEGREKVPREQKPPVPRAEEEPPRQERRRSAPSHFGTLALRVQPANAEVIIDGELWGSLAGFEELEVHLPAGRHRIEIRLEGYEPFATDVEIRQGQATPLNVRLAGGARL